MKVLLSILFTLVLIGQLQAQTPLIADEETDTLYIEEEPVVYTQALEVTEEKTVKLYLNGNISVFNNYSVYDPCPECEEFLETYKAAVTPQLSYGLGISLLYAPKNWVIETGADYSIIKEKFDFTAVDGIQYTSNNSSSYLDLKLTAGRWMWRDKKICSAILQGGLVYNRLAGSSGLTLDYYYPDQPVELNSSNKLRENQWSALLNVKLMFFTQRRLKITLEPYYMPSLSNITQKQYPYLELYNRVGVKGGIIFSL